MNKALDILNQQLRDETLWLDSHEEAIAELEEAQLNRREWYQKGYEEAMKPKTCDGCKYYSPYLQQECLHEKYCQREFTDYYEPKDNE